MAVTVDQANIGTMASAASVSSVKATTATVAAGAMIVVLAHRFHGGGTSTLAASVTGPGAMTAAFDKASGTGVMRIYLFYVFAPAGLASGTNVTVTASAGSDITWVMASYLGVDTSGTVVASNGTTPSTSAWASGTVAGVAGNCYIGGAGCDNATLQTSVASPATERIDFNSATTSGSVTLADILSGVANDAVAGTWSPGSIEHVALGVAFQAAAAAAAPVNTPAFQAIPFMR